MSLSLGLLLSVLWSTPSFRHRLAIIVSIIVLILFVCHYVLHCFKIMSAFFHSFNLIHWNHLKGTLHEGNLTMTGTGTASNGNLFYSPQSWYIAGEQLNSTLQGLPVRSERSGCVGVHQLLELHLACFVKKCEVKRLVGVVTMAAPLDLRVVLSL